MSNDIKLYIVLNDNENSNYFRTIVEKSLPMYNWCICYVDDIPLGGNFYIGFSDSISILYKHFISNKIIKISDILNDSFVKDNLVIASFNFDIDSIKINKEIKRNAYNFLVEETKAKIEKIKENLLKIKNIPPNEIVEEIKTEEVKVENVVLLNEDNKIQEFNFLLTDIVNQLISGNKTLDRSLDSFEGIKLFSSNNPDKFIFLTNSTRKDYPNKMLISDLMLIIKAANMLGTDSIKFQVRT